MMTVRELIEELSKMPQDDIVVVWEDSPALYIPVNGVQSIKISEAEKGAGRFLSNECGKSIDDAVEITCDY